ncbi:hypothetical protein Ahy_A04g019669 [Arachis hypogaea]|uniref:Uncharacterized protein n=1 Tax=Arachis hypogaea TaxID=3818 RepID=A0A445DGF1_ARAHY|nr:hypothetical protein Ahy_A04g019669 [Arachis hypogaea]
MDSDSKKVKVQQEFVDDIDVLLNETKCLCRTRKIGHNRNLGIEMDQQILLLLRKIVKHLFKQKFVETHQSTNNKSLDKDPLDVIAHLQAKNKKSKELVIRAFQSIFRKEKAGRVQCHGRVTIPTLLKKNEEIVTLKQQHAADKATVEGKIDVIQKEVDELISLVKMTLQQKSSEMDLEILTAQLGSTSGNPNNDANEEVLFVVKVSISYHILNNG